METSYLIVINPMNGITGKRWLRSLKARLYKQKTPYHVVKTTGNDVKDLLRLKARCNIVTDVVAIGGNGLMHLVVQAFLGTQVRVGLLPAGSGNDFSRALYSRKHNKLDVVTQEVVTSVSVLEFDNNIACNTLGTGIDHEIVASTSRGLKCMAGRLSYMLVALKKLFTYKSEYLEVFNTETDVAELVFSGRALVAAVSNGKFFGGGLPVSPEGTFDSDNFYLAVSEDKGFVYRVAALLHLLVGQHPRLDSVLYIPVTSAVIRNRSLKYQVDGESWESACRDLKVSQSKERFYLKMPV